MISVSVDDIRRLGKQFIVAVAALAAALMLIATVLWRDRVPLDSIELDPMPHIDAEAAGVSMTWFGVSTMLIDDGETQILIDGFISRPGLFDILLQRPLENDAATINFVLNTYRVRRLAAIIPVHSHFDHAMDIGAIANRSSASILGSESAAQIGRGAGVPEDQIVVVEDGAEYSFGKFTVRFIESVHAPVGLRGSIPLPGTIDEPVVFPASVSSMREGGSYTVIVSHPEGTALVQGSAGVLPGALKDVAVDTVLLGVGLIEGLGRDYIEQYWNETVTATGATTVFPVHFDDYTRPFGEIDLPPDFLDDFSKTCDLLLELRDTWDTDTTIFLPAFGVATPLFYSAPGDTTT